MLTIFLLIVHLSAASFPIGIPSDDHTVAIQAELGELEDSIAVAADLLQNSELVQERRKASARIEQLLGQALRMPGSWDYPFDRIPQISVLRPEDGTIRLFTWQLYLDPDHYRHHGFIQLRKQPDNPIRLQDRSDEYIRPETTVGHPDHWLGAVYYNIHACEYKRNRYWLLFGFDGLEAASKRKVVDVLTIDREGNPVFGSPVFQYQDPEGKVMKEKQRLVLDYATGSHVRLNYDDHYKMILFDHLMPYADDRNGLGLVNIPDGTYEGFRFEKGIWLHIEKVFDQVMETAPVDFPVLDDRKGKNIFGK